MQNAECRIQKPAEAQFANRFSGVLLNSAFCILPSAFRYRAPNVGNIGARNEPLRAPVLYMLRSFPASSFLIPSSRNFLFCGSGA
jgi:hypothetical protein